MASPPVFLSFLLVLGVGLAGAFLLRRRLAVESSPSHALWSHLILLSLFTVQAVLFTLDDTGHVLNIGLAVMILGAGLLSVVVFLNWRGWGQRLWAHGYAGNRKDVPYVPPSGNQQIVGTAVVLFIVVCNGLLIAINLVTR